MFLYKNELHVKSLFWHISTPGATATQSPHFGPGAGFIVLDNVNCNGNEANLTQCQHRGFGDHDCVPAEDAGVFCSGGKSVLWMFSHDKQNCINPHNNIYIASS